MLVLCMVIVVIKATVAKRRFFRIPRVSWVLNSFWPHWRLSRSASRKTGEGELMPGFIPTIAVELLQVRGALLLLAAFAAMAALLCRLRIV